VPLFLGYSITFLSLTFPSNISKVLSRFLLSLFVHLPQYKIPNPSFFNIGSIYSETVDGLLTALVVAILKLFLIDDWWAKFSIRSFIT